MRRREFLGGLTLGTAGILGLTPGRVAAEPPPETTTLRLDQTGALCIAPQFVSEELLRSEGFTDVHYVKTNGGSGSAKAMADGALDIGTTNVWTILTEIDAGAPMVFLAGLHIGCFELFGNDRLQTIQEIPYGVWREYNPEDTVRFYALRLYEVGMIKSTPQKILAEGTDWRFLNELKQELKG
jgi:ABC-type nitrate/sulfonate/bicarbonate transport system substrate-binding protein